MVTVIVMVRQNASLRSVDGQHFIIMDRPEIMKAVRHIRPDLKVEYEVTVDGRQWITRDVQELPSA